MTPLALGDRATLLSTARLTLQTFVKTGRIPELELSRPALTQERGAVVTLYAFGQLRGCVGSLDPLPLYRNVMALTAEAAGEEGGGAPITPDELHQTRIQIALVGQMTFVRSPSDVTVTEHGLAVVGAAPIILLPSVAIHSGWSAEEFLDAACQYAGRPPGAWRDGGVVQRFLPEILDEDE